MGIEQMARFLFFLGLLPFWGFLSPAQKQRKLQGKPPTKTVWGAKVKGLYFSFDFFFYFRATRYTHKTPLISGSKL